jgi:hypothetical protein
MVRRVPFTGAEKQSLHVDIVRELIDGKVGDQRPS